MRQAAGAAMSIRITRRNLSSRIEALVGFERPRLHRDPVVPLVGGDRVAGLVGVEAIRRGRSYNQKVWK